MKTTRETLVEIYHPTFRQGYQRGRAHYFQEQTILTDKQLVECLQSVMLDTSPQEQACEDDLYDAIGQLVGQMSACIIPCQPHEDQTPSVRERFLRTLQHTSGPAGEGLLDLMRTYWDVQDQLARLLDADTFDQALHVGEQRGERQCMRITYLVQKLPVCSSACVRSMKRRSGGSLVWLLGPASICSSPKRWRTWAAGTRNFRPLLARCQRWL
jgi:hypothetical protein